MKKTYNRVNCNLLQAEVYARNAQLLPKENHNYGNRKYMELRNVPYANGIRQEYVEVDYPITPETVKSYAASCDYHNDPAAAMATPPPGANLGDLTTLQDILSKDLEAARAAFAAYNKVKNAKPVPPAVDNSTVKQEKEKGEKENNG